MDKEYRLFPATEKQQGLKYTWKGTILKTSLEKIKKNLTGLIITEYFVCLFCRSPVELPLA